MAFYLSDNNPVRMCALRVYYTSLYYIELLHRQRTTRKGMENIYKTTPSLKKNLPLNLNKMTAFTKHLVDQGLLLPRLGGPTPGFLLWGDEFFTVRANNTTITNTKTSRKWAFISLKDHKPNFNTKTNMQLNRTKPQIGK